MTAAGSMRRKLRAPTAILVLVTLTACGRVDSPAEIELLEIGLTTDQSLLQGSRVAAGAEDAPVVAIIGGLGGIDTSSRTVEAAIAAYAARSGRDRPVEIAAIPAVNPESRSLGFPPSGAAYRENAESHVIWRWLGLHAPDLVLVVGDDPAGLARTLATESVAGVGSIPARSIAADADPLAALSTGIPRSAAHEEILRRQTVTPAQLAAGLAPLYGQGFDPPIYIDGMALLAHLGLGNVAHVEALAAPYVDGTRESLGGRFGVSSLVIAGHLVFAGLAERTGDPRYLERARAAADLAFDENGNPLEAMPGHGEMSDAIFMGAAILAAVGRLTGEVRYFDMAVRQIDFMNKLVRRDDGLYRHSPLTDAAWGRGNGFAAIGYALTLSDLSEDHPEFERMLTEYRDFMATLARWQNADGTWRQVVDHPGAYHETSSTAIIGFSMQRGLNRGWLDAAEFAEPVARAWQGLVTRTDADGGFIDVSESTNKQPTLLDYLHREALFGRDARTGSFAMLFAVERSLAGGREAD